MVLSPTLENAVGLRPKRPPARIDLPHILPASSDDHGDHINGERR